MTKRPHTDWNHEPTDPDGIAVPFDEQDTEGHGILPNPAKVAKTREFAARASDEQDGTDGFGPVQDADRA